MRNFLMVCACALCASMGLFARAGRDWIGVESRAFQFTHSEYKLESDGETFPSKYGDKSFRMFPDLTVTGATYFDARGRFGITYGVTMDSLLYTDKDKYSSDKETGFGFKESVRFSYVAARKENMSLSLEIGPSFSEAWYWYDEGESDSSYDRFWLNTYLDMGGHVMYDLNGCLSVRTGLDLSFGLFSNGHFSYDEDGESDSYDLKKKDLSFVQVSIPVAFVMRY